MLCVRNRYVLQFDVVLESSLLLVLSSAHGTGVEFVCMYMYFLMVPPKSFFAGKSLATGVTDKGDGSEMYHTLVVITMVLAREVLVACRTTEWLLTGMCLLMTQ